MFTSIDKALVPSLVGIIHWVLSLFGVMPQMTIEQTVAYVLTSLGVYQVTNKK